MSYKKLVNMLIVLLLIFFVASLTASAASAGKVVSLPALQKAAANDPYGPQGATTPGAVDSVKIVEAALVEAGFLTDNSYAYDGSYGTATIKAYQKWQRSLGSAERYCDGIPGKIDLTKLGEKYGFTVDTSIPDTKSQETKSATKIPITPIKPTTKLPLTPIKPVAEFSVTPISGYAPLEVTFEDESKGNPLWKWWGFGDGTGSNSTANKVTHIYNKPGEYTVFLKVTNKAGTSTKTYPVPITVIDGVTDINLDVPLIKQGDSQWSKDKLGSSSTTIGAKGCAITSTSMVFNYYGVQTNPKDLNIWLKQNNGYAGKNKNEIDWGTAARMSKGKVKFIGSYSTDLTKIKSELNNGHPVIAQVTSKSGGNHFVVITGYSGSTYYINDPGTSASELSYYNKDPAKAIRGIRIYH